MNQNGQRHLVINKSSTKNFKLLNQRTKNQMTTLSGLTYEEVQNRRKQFGTNAVEDGKKGHFWQIVREIVLEPMFIILLVAAAIYFVVGQYSEGIIMLVAICFVTGISIYQENRSKGAVEALKKLSTPRANVIRNGQRIEILSEEVVVDDLIVVEDGHVVPADAQVLELHDFSVNESLLTGESLAIEKDLKDKNQLYQGTMVMGGSCVARVTAIGKGTELGKINQSVRAIEVEKTPLQLQIAVFVRYMMGYGTVAFLLVWGLNFYLSQNFWRSFLQGLTLAMSVIPEEIPVAFSTFMALGAYRLYKDKVIAKNPKTVEALGTATVICTDKTGTITENKMSISAIYDWKNEAILDFTQGSVFSEVLEYAMWASETKPFDEMEKAIHACYTETTTEDKRTEYSLSHEYPLGSTPPFMTHVFSKNGSSPIIAAKGAVESILNRCVLLPEQLQAILQKVHDFTQKGYRVLGVARANVELDKLPTMQEEFEFDFLGLVAFYDPPKQNIATVLRHFYHAGIQVKMITGDAVETAVAIAKQIQLDSNFQHLSGVEVMQLDKEALRDRVKHVHIYARMFPEAKLKIIEALKANGEVVAMTGDGVNDAPALKAAHIGIAMGHRGSEIAKSTASLVLVDDDLSHMVDAISLGRRIYENLKKAIQYIISIHIPIMLLVMMPLVLGWHYTDLFSPVHVIFLELIMGPTCSIIFENEPIEANSMLKPPRKMGANFLSFRELIMSLIQGIVISALCLYVGYFYMGQGESIEKVRTLLFSTLVFCNLFLTLANRSFTYSIFTTIRYKNPLIPLILVVSLGILLMALYVPVFRDLFLFAELNLGELIVSFLVAFAAVMWVEVGKINQNSHHL